jgi:hypothetical protein
MDGWMDGWMGRVNGWVGEFWFGVWWREITEKPNKKWREKKQMKIKKSG